MVKNLFLFLFFIFLLSCKTLNSEKQAAGYWISKPSADSITIIGISGRRMRRSDEVEAAKEDAARKAAMFYHINGKIETISSTGSNILDNASTANVEINFDSNYLKYIDQLSYDPETDVLLSNEALFIRFKYPKTNNNIHSLSEGSLIGFLIIEMWIDPITGYVYTLAIAKLGN